MLTCWSGEEGEKEQAPLVGQRKNRCSDKQNTTCIDCLGPRPNYNYMATNNNAIIS